MLEAIMMTQAAIVLAVIWSYIRFAKLRFNDQSRLCSMQRELYALQQSLIAVGQCTLQRGAAQKRIITPDSQELPDEAYEYASRLAVEGADMVTIQSRCGLPTSEIQLLINLNQYRKSTDLGAQSVKNAISQ